MTKSCSKCKEIKELSEFHKDSSQPAGLSYWCKSCIKVKRKRHYDKTRDKSIADVKIWRKANPSIVKVYKTRERIKHRDRYLAYFKQHYQENKESHKAKSAQWVKANKEQVAAYKKKWMQEYRNTPEGRERINWYAMNRRVRQMKAEGFHTTEEWLELKTQYNHTCPMCKRREPGIKLSKDHVISLINGGTNYINNIQPLCLSCNSQKHRKAIKFHPTGQMELVI